MKDKMKALSVYHIKRRLVNRRALQIPKKYSSEFSKTWRGDLQPREEAYGYG